MPLMTPEDVESLLQGSGGVGVVHAGVSTWGHLGSTDERLFAESEVVAEQRFVKVATGVLPNLAIGGPIEVDGVQLEVLAHQRLDEGNDALSTEGALTMILLRQIGG